MTACSWCGVDGGVIWLIVMIAIIIIGIGFLTWYFNDGDWEDYDR